MFVSMQAITGIWNTIGDIIKGWYKWVFYVMMLFFFFSTQRFLCCWSRILVPKSLIFFPPFSLHSFLTPEPMIYLLFLRSNPPRVLFSFLFFIHLDVAMHNSTFARATTPTSAPPRPTCSVSSSLFLFSSGSVSSSPYHWFPSFVVRKKE